MGDTHIFRNKQIELQKLVLETNFRRKSNYDENNNRSINIRTVQTSKYKTTKDSGCACIAQVEDKSSSNFDKSSEKLI